MNETTELKKRGWGSILSSVPPSQPTNVKAMRKWDDMESTIHKCRNYLVQAQAEEHKAAIMHKETKERVEEAQAMLAEAECRWRDASKTLLGVDIDKGEAQP